MLHINVLAVSCDTVKVTRRKVRSYLGEELVVRKTNLYSKRALLGYTLARTLPHPFPFGSDTKSRGYKPPGLYGVYAAVSKRKPRSDSRNWADN